MCFFTGSYGDYQWLESYPDLDTFIKTCPQSVLGKFLVITSVDSGEFRAAATLDGWRVSEGIAYSPRIDSIDDLPEDAFYSFSEWYIYDVPTQVGRISKENIFASEIAPPDVFTFVNYFGFSFSNPEMQPVVELFWKQLNWMRPVSYVADGANGNISPASNGMAFVSRDPICFQSVRRSMENYIWPYSSPGK